MEPLAARGVTEVLLANDGWLQVVPGTFTVEDVSISGADDEVLQLGIGFRFESPRLGVVIGRGAAVVALAYGPPAEPSG